MTSSTRQQERKEWAEYCKEQKQDEDLIEHYAYKILREKPDYERSFEENDEIQSEINRFNSQRTEKTSKLFELETKGDISERESNRRLREMRRRYEQEHILIENAPTGILHRRVDKLHYMCRCTGESLRNGELCEVCKLTKNVESYMMSLFKEAAKE